MTPYFKSPPNSPFGKSLCKWNDTISLARFRAPDLSKSLGTVGSILTDVDNWKNDNDGNKKATKNRDDDGRLDYCCKDVAVNVEITDPLLQVSIKHGAFNPLPEILKPSGWPANRPWNLYEFDNLRQELWTEAHRVGIRIDQDLRYRMEVLLTQEVEYHYKNLQELAHSIGLKNLDGIQSDEDDLEEEDYLDAETACLGAESAEAIDGLKPGSSDNIRHLLYDVWHLSCPAMLSEKEFLTNSGQESTSDVVLRAHLANDRLTDLQREFIKNLRQYRRKRNKGLGTILIPFRLNSQDKKRGLVWPDGRIRSSLGTLLTSVGRGNSRKPNVQNIGARKGAGVWFDRHELAHRYGIPYNFADDTPDFDTINSWKKSWKKYASGESNVFDPRYLDHRCDYMDEDKFKRRRFKDKKTGEIIGDGKILLPFKELFIPDDGNWLFGFDLAAIHMVIVANEWKIPAVVKTYSEGIDLHNQMAYVLYADAKTGRNGFVDSDGWPNNEFDIRAKPKGAAKLKRELAKTFRYTSIYGAEVMTKLKVITSDENDYGELQYVKFKKEMMEEFDEKWRASEPEWPIQWERMCQEYRDNGGCMYSYLLRRRSGILEDGKLNAVCNYPILATEQDVMGLCEFEVCNLYPIGYETVETCGMNIQVHDFLGGEHRKEKYREIVDNLNNCVKVVAQRIQKHAGWKYPPTAEAEGGPTLRYC